MTKKTTKITDVIGILSSIIETHGNLPAFVFQDGLTEQMCNDICMSVVLNPKDKAFGTRLVIMSREVQEAMRNQGIGEDEKL